MKYALPIILIMLTACSMQTMSNKDAEVVAELADGIQASRYSWEFEKGELKGALSIVVCFPSGAKDFDGSSSTTADPWRQIVIHSEVVDGKKSQVYKLIHDRPSNQITINDNVFDPEKGKVFVVTRNSKGEVKQLNADIELFESEKEALGAKVKAAINN